MRIAVSALILVITAAGVALSAAVFDSMILPSSPTSEAEKAFNTENLIRLHVVANSDSPEDQALKLAVRDAVLARAKDILGSVATKEEAWRVLREDAGKIEAVASERVLAAGKSYGAQVEMGTFPFPERTYGSVTLPGGNYDAVRVILGAGKGRNWWCVLFPPLCFIQLDGNREVKGLALELSPGEALAKLRLDFGASTSDGPDGWPALARPGEQATASPPAFRPPTPGDTRLLLSFVPDTQAGCIGLLSPPRSRGDGDLYRPLLALTAG
ncbi:MAG: stage II sporulation protein R [Firmicutes bacterium]|nr:stage II sporulation protein R [Bacillota bacterium]MDH7496429.1 stage II sporulation protein R [Bacillota bacterium]